MAEKKHDFWSEEQTSAYVDDVITHADKKLAKPGDRQSPRPQDTEDTVVGPHPTDRARGYRRIEAWAGKKAADIEAENDERGVPERAPDQDVSCLDDDGDHVRLDGGTNR